jgi:hypothetical protein
VKVGGLYFLRVYQQKVLMTDYQVFLLYFKIARTKSCLPHFNHALDFQVSIHQIYARAVHHHHLLAHVVSLEFHLEHPLQDLGIFWEALFNC